MASIIIEFINDYSTVIQQVLFDFVLKKTQQQTHTWYAKQNTNAFVRMCMCAYLCERVRDMKDERDCVCRNLAESNILDLLNRFLVKQIVFLHFLLKFIFHLLVLILNMTSI